MIDLDEARVVLAQTVRPLAPAVVPLAESLGHRLAATVRSDVDLPPADVSAMDGYAVRHTDLAGGLPLPVVAEVAAGEVGMPLAAGSADRIFTGAPLPEGADTVVPQEQARVDGKGRVILEPCAAGSHVRRRGEVIAEGAEVLTPGAWVTPQMVSVMASCGAASVTVVPRPAIAVVVTGAEIVDTGERPAPGQIRDSNGPLLAALAASAGFRVVRMARAPDTREALRDEIGAAVEAAELVLTTGGVSVGDYDLVPEIVVGLGGEILFHRVRVKPGKPVLAARVGSKMLFGLPGNPLAVLAGWRLFAWPAAAVMAGDEGALLEAPVEARLAADVRSPRSRTELRPAALDDGPGGPVVRPLSWRGSHDVATAAGADALARFEPESEYRAGCSVACYPLAVADPRPGSRCGRRS